MGSRGKIARTPPCEIAPPSQVILPDWTRRVANDLVEHVARGDERSSNEPRAQRHRADQDPGRQRPLSVPWPDLISPTQVQSGQILADGWDLTRPLWLNVARLLRSETSPGRFGVIDRRIARRGNIESAPVILATASSR